jgi:20S proteasome subunit beta 5
MAMLSLCGLSDDTLFKGKCEIEENEAFETFQSDNTVNQMNLYTLPGNPVENMRMITARDTMGRPIELNFHHGTTTLGFMYQGGIVLAVDSRATGGQFIGSNCMKKIVEINDFMLGTLAGGAADCVYWDRVLSKQCRLHELRNKERISVTAASKIMANMIYYYKGYGLSIGMMLAGYDKNGPSLFYIDNDGSRTPGKVFSVGSGSIYAFGVLDSDYRWDLSDEEAHKLGQRAIFHATHRDAYSGGIVRVYHITKDGWKHIKNEDCDDIYDRIQKEEK